MLKQNIQHCYIFQCQLKPSVTTSIEKSIDAGSYSILKQRVTYLPCLPYCLPVRCILIASLKYREFLSLSDML
jgi:hypothetical protein